MRNKKLYYFLSYTWGLPMNMIGFIVEFFLKIIFKILKKTPEKYGPCRIYKIGGNWGGALEIGNVIIMCENPTEYLLNHEFGHTIQNAILGPFYIPLVWFPSMVRYNIREVQAKCGKELPPYDSVWFEGTATKLGYNYIEYFK